MTSSGSSRLGLLDSLYHGIVRWDLARPFPEQEPHDVAAGDRLIAAVLDLLRSSVDPIEVDRSGQLPADLPDRLRGAGLFGLTAPTDLGGLALSPMNALRVVQAVASWCPAVGWMLALSNGFGAGNYLPLIQPGPLRDLITDAVRAGAIGGSADTEAHGAANNHRRTTATPVDDGAAYLLSGEKIFIGNAADARLLDVSATVRHGDTEQVRIFFVELDQPGVQLVCRQEFMGLHGASIGVLRLTGVRVPVEHLLPAQEDQWRDDPALVRLAIIARMLVIAAPALAMAKRCLYWTRDFVNRREMDHRPLADYEEIQHRVASNAADVFAMQTLADWSLSRGELDDKVAEFAAAKNLMAVTCWRVVERTMSIMGGEGYETAISKARRNAPALPLEQLARDARALLVAGGVDFLLDYWSALSSVQSCYHLTEPPVAQAPMAGPTLPEPVARHVHRIEVEARALADRCAQLTKSHTAEELAEREHPLVLIGELARSLLSMALVLARAEQRPDPLTCSLADTVCIKLSHRITALRAELDSVYHKPHAELSRHVLEQDLATLLRDVIVEAPEVVCHD